MLLCQLCLQFHNQQILLFAEFEPTGLLDFMQRLHRMGVSFNLSRALSICNKRLAYLRGSSTDAAGRMPRGSTTTSSGSETGSSKGDASCADDQHSLERKMSKEHGGILGLYAAVVYLLCHMKRNKEALDVLVNKLGVGRMSSQAFLTSRQTHTVMIVGCPSLLVGRRCRLAVCYVWRRPLPLDVFDGFVDGQPVRFGSAACQHRHKASVASLHSVPTLCG